MKPCSKCKLGPVCLTKGFVVMLNQMILKGVREDTAEVLNQMTRKGGTPALWKHHADVVMQRVLDEDVPADCPEAKER